MKSLVVLIRIIIVGCLWSIVFIEGIRVIMLCNWHFDIFWPDHWRQARALWKAGWVIKAPKEWAFVIILVTFIPMLVTGWWTLCLVAWEKIIYDIVMLPLTLYHRFIKAPINVMTTNNKYGVVKKKSYKQIRPAGVGGVRMPISDYGDHKPQLAAPIPSQAASPFATARVNPTPAPKPMKKADIPSTIDHALFRFDDDEDDFDLDIDSFEKADILRKKETKPKPFDDDEEDIITSKPRNNNNKNDNKKAKKAPIESDDSEENDNRRNKRKNDERDNRKNDEHDNRNKNRNEKNNRDNKADNKNQTAGSDGEQPRSPVYDALKQKGYDVISDITIKGTQLDYIGVAENEICLCLVDKESGDWLADEELFNGEEPLWFSENSHRISPVRKLDVARKNIQEKLQNEGFEQEIKSFVIIQMANIINADDMFEIWDDLQINVTRINRGAPKDIPLLSKTLDEAENTLSKKDLEQLRKLLKSIK